MLCGYVVQRMSVEGDDNSWENVEGMFFKYDSKADNYEDMREAAWVAASAVKNYFNFSGIPHKVVQK